MGEGNDGRLGDEQNQLAHIMSGTVRNEGESVQPADDCFRGSYTTHMAQTMREATRGNVAPALNWGTMNFQATPAPLQSVLGDDAATQITQDWQDIGLRSFTSTKDQPWQPWQMTDTQCSSGETGTGDTASPIDQAWTPDLQHGTHHLQQHPNRAVSLPANLARTSSGAARIHNDEDDVSIDARLRHSSLPQEDMCRKASTDLDQEQKEKRRKCNRDSARRVKQRKEAHLKDLEKRVTTLSVEKEIMDKKYAVAMHDLTKLHSTVPLLVARMKAIMQHNEQLQHQVIQVQMRAVAQQTVARSRDAGMPQPVNDHRHPASNRMVPVAPVTPATPRSSSMDPANMQGIPPGGLHRISSGYMDDSSGLNNLGLSGFHPGLF